MNVTFLSGLSAAISLAGIDGSDSSNRYRSNKEIEDGVAVNLSVTSDRVLLLFVLTISTSDVISGTEK